MGLGMEWLGLFGGRRRGFRCAAVMGLHWAVIAMGVCVGRVRVQ